ncbi:IS256 family transposase [Mycobacterium shinjukuense]|uniref:Mutator family transposase n=1 Tax=Mycobacterium shinjukuense TaxID=398694 RepID=A0A7I7MLP7_9MYCO|nr:IS256 family transposase [Mycobacterium shinjukuense]BBX73204.1 transposase for insertion sequence element IS1081 [Mycobacterium shinjukuense]
MNNLRRNAVETLLADRLAMASPDLLRDLLSTFIQALMSAEADALCHAGYGQRTQVRANSRNGYRRREFDTRVGTIELAIPKLRVGSYFPDWLLARHRRAERALTDVVAACYLLGVSTRRVERLADALGVMGLSRSQLAAVAAELDETVTALRSRPLDHGRYPFIAVDALGITVRRQTRICEAQLLLATGVNTGGHREMLGAHLSSADGESGWLSLFHALITRGLSGVALVTGDSHAGLLAAIDATMPGAVWQRCITHYTTNLVSITPTSSRPWVHALLHSIFDQPDAESVAAQYDRVIDALGERLPEVAGQLTAARPELLAYTAFPRELWRQIWSTNGWGGRTLETHRTPRGVRSANSISGH